MENITINLTPLFEAIILLLAALITAKLIPWIKKKTTDQQYENIKSFAKIAVYAAEQMFAHGSNEEKLEYTLQQLEKQGFKVDLDTLRTAVEQAVYELKTEQQLQDSYIKRTDADHPPDGETEEEEETVTN